MNPIQHIPVLKEAVLRTFQNMQGQLLDGTFGGGGHTRALLEENINLSVIGLDIDPDAKLRAEKIKQEFPGRFDFYPINFSELEMLKQSFEGIFLDLGVSSFQLDAMERGFSFNKDGPLDMRMNPNRGLSAREFLKQASPDMLTRAMRDYGEEPQWRSVVQAILRHRNSTTWDTTVEFVQFLKKNTKIFRSKKSRLHPATRVFQGLRIVINDELKHLEKGLIAAFKALKPQGKMGVIAFHSLEDRRVKQYFYGWCGRSCSLYDAQPRQLKTIQAELLTRKPITATDDEVARNPRSRSAKYRILKKI